MRELVAEGRGTGKGERTRREEASKDGAPNSPFIISPSERFRKNRRREKKSPARNDDASARWERPDFGKAVAV
jgi:hypothetical protein